MLKKIISVRNVGRFRNSALSGNPQLAKHTYIVGANGYGKTTLCAVLRSLKTGDASHILGRKSLGVTDDPTVEFLFDTGPIRFDGTQWSAPRSGITIFDGVFVAENVHSGEVVDIEQKRNLYRVIIGDQGVKLAEEEADLAQRSRSKTTEITTAARAVQAHVPAGMKIDGFVALPLAADVDTLIAEHEKRVETARQAGAIKDRKALSEFPLPDLPNRFEQVLGATIDDMARDAEAKLATHIAAHGMADGGGNWIAEGLEHADDTCPFCGQGISGSELIAAFRSVFSDRYEALAAEINATSKLVLQLFGDTALARLETLAEQNKSAAEFWARYCAIDAPSLELPPDILSAASSLRQAALELLTKKAGAPLEAVRIDARFAAALTGYNTAKVAVTIGNNAIKAINTAIAAKKVAIGATDPKAEEAELARLKACKIRHTPAVATLCDAHSSLVTSKDFIDKRKEAARVALDTHTRSVVKPYQNRINSYLIDFNAGFSITETKHGYPGGVATSTYQLLINDTAVDVGDGKTPVDQPSFKNTLSSGDRTTLALAFFLAHLERDPAVFSAGDLVGHLNCRYLTHLDLKVAQGELAKPKLRDDPAHDALVERGRLHEQGFVDHLAKQGGSVTVISGIGIDQASVAQTRQAMARGDGVIVQAALRDGHWSGRADVLRRVEAPSGLGAWSYEVTDTKLARETKGNTVLQLSLYSDLLATMQQKVPETAHVVTPGTEYLPEAYRVADFAAFYRRIRRGLETFAAAPPQDSLYPSPIEHCEVCRWREPCASRRRADDHLSYVAGIAKTQIEELVRRGVGTMAALATLPIPLQWRPDRGTAPSYEKVREQARLQVQGRRVGQLLHETLPPVAQFGLFRLPEPSPGDIFFDFEGDPFVDNGGLEFLFGYLYVNDDSRDTYVGDWVTTRQHERAAFERFIDFVTERLTKQPGLHIYHFAPYEPAALKRIMGRYATREDEVDNLLRAGVFVDLYAIVRQSIRASVESYSIKKLEPLYRFDRTVPLTDVGGAMARVQACLELGDPDGISPGDQTAVIGYNRDDCASTRALRDWLEGVRSGLIAQGNSIARPQAKVGEIGEDLSAWKRRVAGLVARLISDVPDDVAERSAEQQARWILAHLIDFFGRENKAVWWEYYRLSDLSAEDLLHERAGLGGLDFIGSFGGTVKAPIHRYRFAVQETDVRVEDELKSVGGEKLGSVVAVSNDNRTIDVKKRQDTAGFHPEAVFAHKFVRNRVLAESVFRIGEYVADHGIIGSGSYRAARDLLLKVAPRLRGLPLEQAGDTTLAAAMRAALSLDLSVFPVQGPPGAGKTHAGARMICALVRHQRTVGVTANSHKVIRHLLDKSREAAAEQQLAIQCIQKISDEPASLPDLQQTNDNQDFIDGLSNGCQVGGATGWFWARRDAAGIVDVLFVDEAAQMSLANVLAVSQAAESIVLLGDPRQLEQPIQGSHPDGVAVSALDHILGQHATIEAGRGLFLAETWRLHPDICAFTSELFYEGRLRSRAGLERQEIRSSSRVNGVGLRYLAVQHEGNQNSSPEEADTIKRLVDEILASRASWVDARSPSR